MPFYEYFCKPCKSSYKTFHGVDDKFGPCPKCESLEVSKVVSTLSWQQTSKPETNAGQRVEKFIEEQREILEAEKQEARKDLK